MAVAMSGGVSLAVWMGGVAREVNLLQEASNLRVNEARVSAQGSGAAGQPASADGAAQPRGGQSEVPAPDWDSRSRDLYLNLLRLLDLRVTVEHSRRALAIQRSQIAFARGARTGVAMTCMPAATKTASNAPVYLASRSLIKNFKPSVRSPRSMSVFRACCTVQAAVG